MRALAALMIVAACSSHSSAPPAATGSAAAPAAFRLALGDATVYEQVDRRWRKIDPPRPELRLRADGTAELLNDKTGAVMLTLTVRPDGTVLGNGAPQFAISEHAITSAEKPLPLAIDGDQITVQIDGKAVVVLLGADGNVTVVDRPDGVKWRIAAADPAVRRTAFLVLAITMKTALD